MEVLHFRSTDGAVVIQAVTAAQQSKLWHRFKSRLSPEAAFTYCNYNSSLEGELKLLLPTNERLETVGINEKNFNSLPPIFYETANYNFTLRFSNLACPPSIVHKMQEVCDLFTIVDADSEKGNYIITAPLSFLNEPGIFNLTFRYTPRNRVQRTDSISFRVVSPKLDTKDDFLKILNEINVEYSEIIYQYLTKTVQNLVSGGRTNSDVVWISIFKSVIANYIKAVTYIVNRPHIRQTNEVHYSKADRIKHWTPQMSQLYEQSKERNTLERDYFRHEVTINTSNTAENRFVKFSIERIKRRLDSVFRNLLASYINITETERIEIENYSKSLRKLANSPLFRGLKAEPMRSESMVLQKRTGYSQVYRYWIMLQRGIELYEGSTQIGVRPVWELYELWCFLKMRKMVAKVLNLSFDNPDEIREDPTPMIEPFKQSDQQHTVIYNKDNDVIKLFYQHTYNRCSGEVHTATTDNRPDIVLTIVKPDGMELTYLFDAKYRVIDDEEFSKEDKEDIELSKAADFPPPDAINQMHRYRDAIYYGEKQNNVRQHTAKEIIGGYILFPGRGTDDAVRQCYYFKSIESVNIGAFPLLPDKEDENKEGSLLYQHLQHVLNDKVVYNHIKGSIPQRGLVYSRSEAESNDIVLVGYYKNDKHKNIILKNRIYYVPAGIGKGSINLISGFENAKYLLLFGHDTRMLLRLDGKGPNFYTAETLKGFGFSPSGEYYLGFHLASSNAITIDDFDINNLNLFTRGKQSFAPYFTTIKKLKKQIQ